MIEFGVGKLSFSVGEPSESEDYGASVDRIKAVLSEMPNITDLDISDDAGGISFVISIPRHLHAVIPPSRRASERFRVRTIPGYQSDFTFVASLDPVEPFTGSDGVVIVREQLQKQLKEKSAGVSLVSQGPSPFHADFRLGTAEEVAGTDEPLLDVDVFTGHVEPVRGYDQALFLYDPSLFENELAALDALQYELSGELALFYMLALDRELRLKRSIEIGQSTERLIDLHSKRGIKGAYNRLFRAGREARALALAVMQAEFAIADDRESYREAAANTYSHSDGYFRRYLDNQAAEEFKSYVENGARVVRHLESGRTKELEVAIIAGATLIGGISGGVVSAIMGAS